MLSGTCYISSVKINWDASVCTKSRKIQIGIVVRDHIGLVLGYLGAPLATNTHPLVAEHYILQIAIKLGTKMGFSDFEVQMEENVQVLINAINETEECGI